MMQQRLLPKQLLYTSQANGFRHKLGASLLSRLGSLLSDKQTMQVFAKKLSDPHPINYTASCLTLHSCLDDPWAEDCPLDSLHPPRPISVPSLRMCFLLHWLIGLVHSVWRTSLSFTMVTRITNIKFPEPEPWSGKAKPALGHKPQRCLKV